MVRNNQHHGVEQHQGVKPLELLGCFFGFMLSRSQSCVSEFHFSDEHLSVKCVNNTRDCKSTNLALFRI
jgi:hypothetical protein